MDIVCDGLFSKRENSENSKKNINDVLELLDGWVEGPKRPCQFTQIITPTFSGDPARDIYQLIEFTSTTFFFDPLLYLYYIDTNSFLNQIYYRQNRFKLLPADSKYLGNSLAILACCFISTCQPYMSTLDNIVGRLYFQLSEEEHTTLFCFLLDARRPYFVPNLESRILSPLEEKHHFYARRIRASYASSRDVCFWSNTTQIYTTLVSNYFGCEFLAHQLNQYAKRHYTNNFPPFHPSQHTKQQTTRPRVFNIFNGSPTLLTNPADRAPTVINIEYGVAFPNGILSAILCVNFVVDVSTLVLDKNNSLIFSTDEKSHINYHSFSVKLVRCDPKLPISKYPVFLNSRVIGYLNVPQQYRQLTAISQSPRPVAASFPVKTLRKPTRTSLVSLPRLLIAYSSDATVDVFKLENEKAKEIFVRHDQPLTKALFAAVCDYLGVETPKSATSNSTYSLLSVLATRSAEHLVLLNPTLDTVDYNSVTLLQVPPPPTRKYILYVNGSLAQISTPHQVKFPQHTLQFIAPDILSPKLSFTYSILRAVPFCFVKLSHTGLQTSYRAAALFTASEGTLVYENSAAGEWLFQTTFPLTYGMFTLFDDSTVLLKAIHQVNYKTIVRAN